MKLSFLLKTVFTTVLAVCTFSSCSLMESDLSHCPSGLYVHFKYDYNTLRADLFNDHVGSVRVYVFTPEGKFVTSKEVAKTASSNPLASPDFAVHFDEAELAPGNYFITAWAQQRSTDDCLAAAGAKFRYPKLQVGDDHTTLIHTLDRTTTTTDIALVDNGQAPLDTLWATLDYDHHQVTTQRGCVTRDTLSLIRDTKQLNITLRQTEESALMADDSYEVKIIDRNGQLLANNDVDPTDTRLEYTPYMQWTTQLGTDAHATPRAEEVHLQATAHYELNFNRLLLHNLSTDNARLIITNKETGQKVVDFDLPGLLSDGRDAYDYWHYSRQEYLDREYKYRLDFILNGDKWQEVSLRIEVLDWAKRYQNIDF